MVHDDDIYCWNMFNLYADVDARSMTPSRNTRSYTLRSVPSSPGRSFFSSCLRSLMMLHLLSTFTRVKYHYHSIYFAKYQYYILHIESPCQCPKSALLIGPLVHHVTSWVKQPKKDGVKRPPNGLQQEVRGWRAPRLRVIASH